MFQVMQPKLGLPRMLGIIVLIWSWAGAASAAETTASGSATSETSLPNAGFEEPLMRTASTSGEEDEALARAVRAYREAAAGDDFSALEGFLAGHPQSGWRVAVLTNLGLSYYHYGYFSKTIEAL